MPKAIQKFKKIYEGHEILFERPGFEPLPKLIYDRLLSKSKRIIWTEQPRAASCQQCMGIRIRPP